MMSGKKDGHGTSDTMGKSTIKYKKYSTNEDPSASTKVFTKYITISNSFFVQSNICYYCGAHVLETCSGKFVCTVKILFMHVHFVCFVVTDMHV